MVTQRRAAQLSPDLLPHFRGAEGVSLYHPIQSGLCVGYWASGDIGRGSQLGLLVSSNVEAPIFGHVFV